MFHTKYAEKIRHILGLMQNSPKFVEIIEQEL
jgi:hypothetical protein